MTMAILITFPDGSSKKYDAGITPGELAKEISEGLYRNCVAAQVNDRLVDLDRPITENAQLKLLTAKEQAGIDVIRHSAAHICAQAVKRLYPDALQTIGPVIENGFFFDFDNLPITDDDLPKIEEEMRKIIKEKLATVRKDYANAQEAIADYKDNPYKIELIEEHAAKGLSNYAQGEYHDLCRGPHCPHTGMIEALKLTRTAKAYWRGDAKNKQLTRIYGLVFAKKAELDAHLTMLAEAEKRDHRKIGAEMELFMISEDIGPGLVIWLPRGNLIKEALEAWAKETEEAWGYQRVTTPVITKEGLFHTSEHLPHYSESMFPPMKMDNETYYIKPMNCPFHHMVYKARSRSYRELPLRIAEYGWCHRYEQSGAITGLMRVRGMQMNDAHIYCTREQAVKEFVDAIKLHEYYYKILGITEYSMVLSLRDPKSDKYHGDDAMWRDAELLMREAMEQSGVKYTVEIGGAAFYGPKIDFQIKSAIGREFTASTNQIDLFMPVKFGLKYAGEDGKEHTPVCIHRAPLGTHERFIGFLIEHFAGKFPVWLSPEQVRILPIADRHNEWATAVVAELKKQGLRASVDDRPLTTNKKVREAELAKVNYILVVGDREVEAKTVNVRTRDNQILGEKTLSDFRDTLVAEVKEKR
jgi:threonyl-tRNA synthetase